MNLALYLRDNLAGAWQVMRWRPEGLNRLDTSLEGFWRSFGVILILIPVTYVSLLSQDLYNRESGVAERLTSGSVGTFGVAIILDLITFPVLLALFARVLGLGSRYVQFIVTRNWASVIFATLGAIVDLLHLGGVVPSPALPFAGLIVMAVSIYFSYVVTRTALAVSLLTAIPIVVLDILVSFTIWSVFRPIA
jgi:hypothetical protein